MTDVHFAGRALDAAPVPEPEPALHGRPTSCKAVLVVDDDEQILNLASRILVSEGYGVMTATGGREGVSLYRNYRKAIGAIVLDMAMPRMNGAQVLRALRIIDRDVRVVLSSGHDVDPLLQAEGVWPSAFLPKPYRPTALVAAVAGMLG